MGKIKYLIVGTERSGSTLLSAILANSGADFGIAKGKDWDRASGDYEHKILVGTYKHLKRALLFKKYSDRLTARENRKIIARLVRLYSKVAFSKYPPLSEYLPSHIKKAGFDLRLICVIRKFNDFAISRISKKGGSFDDCKQAYLSTYQTSLLNLSLYGGCIVCYEDVIDLEKVGWATVLESTCHLNSKNLLAERQQLVKPTFLENKIQSINLDQSCTKLYSEYKKLSMSYFPPAYVKQHTKILKVENSSYQL